MFQVKDIFRGIIAFLMVFVIIALQICIFTSQKVFNASTYTRYFENEEYISLLTRQIDTSLEQMGTLYDVPADVLTGGVNTDQIKSYGQKGTKLYIDYFRGDVKEYNAVYDMTEIHSRVEAYVRNYCQLTGKTYEGQYEAVVGQITDEAQEIIQGLIIVLNPSLVTSTSIADKTALILKRIPMMEIGLVLLLVILVGLQYLLNRRHPKRLFWWCGSSLLVAGIILLIPGLYLQFTNVANGFGLQSESVSWIMSHCIASLLLWWNVMAGIIVVVAVASMTYYIYNRKKRMTKMKRYTSRIENK